MTISERQNNQDTKEKKNVFPKSLRIYVSIVEMIHRIIIKDKIHASGVSFSISM